jgi:hypothetical protein
VFDPAGSYCNWPLLAASEIDGAHQSCVDTQIADEIAEMDGEDNDLVVGPGGILRPRAHGIAEVG